MGKPVTVAAKDIKEANMYIKRLCIQGPNNPMHYGRNTIVMSPQLRGNKSLDLGSIDAKMCNLQIDTNLTDNSQLDIGDVKAGGTFTLAGSVADQAAQNVNSIETGGDRYGKKKKPKKLQNLTCRGGPCDGLLVILI